MVRSVCFSVCCVCRVRQCTTENLRLQKKLESLESENKFVIALTLLAGGTRVLHTCAGHLCLS